jgi:predicted oxidoreductase
VRLNLLSRKSLDGLQTDLSSQVLAAEAHLSHAFSLLARSRDLAAVGAMATTHLKARFLADAFSQAALPVEARKFRDIARCFWAVARPGLANT